VKPRDDKKITQIFCATLRLTAECGMAGITMRDIAREAGIATGTLYIYFKDKVQLINALFEDCRKSSAAIYFEGYREDDSFETGFRKIWDNIFGYRTDHFDEAVFLEQCYHSPYIGESQKEMSLHLLKPFYRLIERGKKEGAMKDLDTFLLLIFMIGSISEIVKYYKYNNKKINPEMVEDVFGMCWDGLKQ
jgi:TetR/AcrR family transcriptional regulator, repressor of fatR-cypB operon